MPARKSSKQSLRVRQKPGTNAGDGNHPRGIRPVPASTEFPWISSHNLHFTPAGDFPLKFPPACPLLLHFLQFANDHRLAPSHHDYLELSLICEGGGRFIVEDRQYTATAGDLLVVGNREFHLWETDPKGNGAKIASVHFMPELMHATGGLALDIDYLRPFFYRTTEFTHHIAAQDLPPGLLLDRIAAIRREIENADEDYPLAVRTYMADILLEVRRFFRRRGGAPISQDLRVRDFERLRGVFNYLRSHCHEEVSMQKMAAMAHMSPNYFCRFFRTVTGNTFTDYVMRLRVDLATEYLAAGQMSMTDIAYAVGFCSHSYFDRVFKRLKGVTPLKYRREPGITS